MEQVHLAAETAMVTLFRFLQHVDVRIELGLFVPGRAVDTRQHGVVRIAAPIGAGHLHQLEGIADLPGRGHVRTAAQIEPVTLRVDLEVLPLGNGVDQLDLVGLALVAKHFFGLLAAPDFLRERPVALDDLAHLFLDDGKVFRRERLVAGEIVIEAVFDHGADRHLRAGPKFLHGFGQHMSRVVADQFQRARIGPRDDLDRAGFAQRIGHIAQFAIE